MLKLILILALLTSNVVHAQTIRNGEDLLRAMHDRYKDSWYHTVTFTQKSTTYKLDGTSSAETWYETALLPGKLRIDIGPAADGKGYIFSNGSVTVIKENKVVANVKDVNMLLVLGFDVYRQDPETTINVVKGEGYDLSKLREDSWEGKPAYVVGAEKDDLKSKQFWLQRTRCCLCGKSNLRAMTLPSSTISALFTINRWREPGSRQVWKYIPMARKSSPRITPIFRQT
jgi:hypothetical protein